MATSLTKEELLKRLNERDKELEFFRRPQWNWSEGKEKDKDRRKVRLGWSEKFIVVVNGFHERAIEEREGIRDKRIPSEIERVCAMLDNYGFPYHKKRYGIYSFDTWELQIELDGMREAAIVYCIVSGRF